MAKQNKSYKKSILLNLTLKKLYCMYIISSPLHYFQGSHIFNILDIKYLGIILDKRITGLSLNQKCP